MNAIIRRYNFGSVIVVIEVMPEKEGLYVGPGNVTVRIGHSPCITLDKYDCKRLMGDLDEASTKAWPPQDDDADQARLEHEEIMRDLDEDRREEFGG